MKSSPNGNDEQSVLWNGAAGQSWVEAQELLDGMLRPFEELLVEAAAAEPRASVLDVGCGTGGTTLAIARRLGASARCVGVDLSEPMLDCARRRAEQAGAAVSFIHADAEHHPFQAASFELVVSRFGVMFFNDPVQAFANLRRATRIGGELCCIAWRGPSENPFMTAAERAAGPLLPSLPAREPGAPGQFAFADGERVRRILDESGWSRVELQPLDLECGFPELELARYVGRVGPLGRALREADEATRTRVIEAVLPAFERFVEAGTVRFRAACWKIEAQRVAA